MPETTLIRTLADIGAIDPERLTLLHPRTRDSDALVYRDPTTGVIVLGGEYSGDDRYVRGELDPLTGQVESAEDDRDTVRRVADFGRFARRRRIVDVGCGSGTFLRAIAPLAAHAAGVELNHACVRQLREDGFSVESDIEDLAGEFDTAYMFHVLEHLPDPLDALARIGSRLSGEGALLVIEVPSANDLLIRMGCAAFFDFTFWSQHLVLHTRDSLQRLLRAGGFATLFVKGIQRYGPANHLRWLAEGRAGGHESWLSLLDSEELVRSYEKSLSSVDATDTLVAIAQPLGERS